MRFLILILSLVSLTSIAQNPVANLTRNVGILRFVLRSDTTRYSIGTGTLVQRIDHSKNEGKAFLITAKHVLPTFAQNDKVTFQIYMDSSKDGYFRVPLQIFDSTGRYVSFVKIDPDGNDLAVIDVTGIFLLHPNLQKFLPNVIPADLLAINDTLIQNDVTVGDDVIFVGYPNMLYDKRNSFPIVRTGIIATDPLQDFYFSDDYRSNLLSRFNIGAPEKLNGFLIDANAVGGSSGSLVCTKPRYVGTDKNGEIMFYAGIGRFYILGVLTDSFFGTDNILTTLTRANLGGVISARQIVKTIDLFYPHGK